MDEKRPDQGTEALIARLRAENAGLRETIKELKERGERGHEPSGTYDLTALLEARRKELSESALQQSREFLLAILDNIPSVVFVKDTEGRYVMFNRRFPELLQCPEEAILLRTDEEIFAADASRVRAQDAEAIAAPAPLQIEETVPTPDGPREFFTVKFPLRGPSGKLLGLCGIATDITDRKRADAERIAFQEQMIQAQRAALRELSTPLVPIAEGVLAMPLIGTIDSVRAKEIMETLLDGISRQRASTAILDITGVRVVDTQVANALIEAARAARLLGAEVLLTGISPAIAQTLVALQLDLRDLTTLATLQSGIAHAMRSRVKARAAAASPR